MHQEQHEKQEAQELEALLEIGDMIESMDRSQTQDERQQHFKEISERRQQRQQREGGRSNALEDEASGNKKRHSVSRAQCCVFNIAIISSLVRPSLFWGEK